MDQKSLKILFDGGGLVSVQAIKAPLEEGWVVHFERLNGTTTVIGTTREPDKAKVFKSLNAVSTAVEEIGFSKLVVCLREVIGDVESPENFSLRE